MNVAIISALIGGATSFAVALASGRATVKSANAGTEGIYAKELPELIEQIKQLNKERNGLSRQLTDVQLQNQQLQNQVSSLTGQIDQLKRLLERKGIEIDE
ncbi:hypothetical protein [Lacticaseibacillus hulanensis]|uniref:hypothetical protein n=1 Tax=Lacticaseibacillus hulanensis TaxID=2493111 RepID=UPI000FD8F615|nr:hypothetical protein [Lacticaseibacillus hulanensis]